MDSPRRKESSPGNYRHHGHSRDGGRMDGGGRGRSRSPDRRHERRRSRSYEDRGRHHEKRYRSRSRSPRRRDHHNNHGGGGGGGGGVHRGGGGGGGGGNNTIDNPEPTRCLGVFGMGLYTTETELQHVFAKYGPLEKVSVVKDAKTGRSRGFAFVYFESLEDAKLAKEQCTGLEIDGRRIRVDYSITQRPHTPTPGIYMGRPTITSGRYDRGGERGGERGERGGERERYRRSPSPYYERNERNYHRSSRRGYDRSRSRSYSPRHQESQADDKFWKRGV